MKYYCESKETVLKELGVTEKGLTTEKATELLEKNGKIYSLDNRRLYAFKTANMKKIRVEWVNINNPKIFKEFMRKFTTIDDGLSIIIKKG